MRGLLRIFVVGFTVVSLMLVAGVGVAASGKSGPADTVKHSVVALFSGHSDQGVQNGTRTDGSKSGEGNTGNGEEDNNGCKPPKKTHKHGTPGHKHHPCGDDDSD